MVVREIGAHGYVGGRWVATLLGRWVANLLGRWVAKLEEDMWLS
jgi:hypothetical protein